MSSEFLKNCRDEIVALWIERTLQGYAGDAGRFLMHERDQFRNPAGLTFRESLPALYEALLSGGPISSAVRALDAVIRLRAVQDFSAAQAVSFVFLLKEILREMASREDCRDAIPTDLTAFERRIDELALLAFDLFMKCREQIWDIRARELSRRTYVRDKLTSGKG